MLAFGFREVVNHEASQACLRAIAHMTHGAFIDIPDIGGNAMPDFISSAANALLSRQLVLEEMVDLALSTRSRLMAVDYNIRMRELCEALNATGSILNVIEGNFNYEESPYDPKFELIQKQCPLSTDLMLPITRTLTQKSNLVMQKLAGSYVGDRKRWLIDSWAAVQNQNQNLEQQPFNELEEMLIKHREAHKAVTPLDLRYALAHAIMSAGY
eukprot:TRINITY_DN18532_c0_g1_i5.p2 TRINITY_DN18532_c0_g1~~TRINITY_DN18532_c0_g1_i5.p2  ORF type:complete len:213 (-),score=43.61 TRINITY_DN18532_c0_g1_i5:423-1061(-)